MKTVGLITEYNPLHNGHLYHIKKARELTGATHVIVVMSGNFIQRGAPAIFDKHQRTSMALLAGADLVLEIPCAFSTSSAQEFASCSIALLDRLGCVDFVCFGSEIGDLLPLSHIASILNHEPKEYTTSLKDFLKQGYSFPLARTYALKQHPLLINLENVDAILNSPNNILAIEYLKALQKRNSNLIPVTITRQGSGYHDTTLESPFISASAIRHMLATKRIDPLIHKQVPSFVFDHLVHGFPIFNDSLDPLLNFTLLTKLYNQLPLHTYADLSPQMEDKLKKFHPTCVGFEETIQQLKSKEYTYTRISRGLLHLILGIEQHQIDAYKEQDYVSYARVLGFHKSHTDLLSNIKKNADIPLITKPTKATILLDGVGTSMFNQDLYASHIYHMMVYNKYHISLPSEFKRPVVFL